MKSIQNASRMVSRALYIFRDDFGMPWAMQGATSTSLSPGNQVDDLPGVAVSKGRRAQRLSVNLGRKFECLSILWFMVRSSLILSREARRSNRQNKNIDNYVCCGL